MNADPLLILGACVLLLGVAIWAAVHSEHDRSEDEESSTLDVQNHRDD